MPRNSSGTYSLPAGNPVVTNTLIQSTWANTTLSDVSTAMTDSLDRNGRGAMLAPLKNIDGTAVAPALTFSSEGTMGIYRAAAGVLGFAVGGALVLSLTSTGLTFTTPLVLPIGSATAPSLTFVANTNTGIYSPATNQVAITTNGSQKLLVDASGNTTIAGTLGVGGTSIGFSGAGANTISAGNATGYLQFQTGGANTRLTIDAAGLFTFATAVTFSSTQAYAGVVTFNNNIALDWKDAGGTARRAAILNAANAFQFGDVDNAIASSATTLAANSQVNFAINGTNLVSVNANGMGVGTAPISTVRIAMSDGTITTLLGFNYSSNTISGIGTNSNHALGFLTNGGERMRIDTGGNVAINTTTTTSGAKLAINGGLYVFQAATLSATGFPGLFSFENPVFRQYIGDGTGYSIAFSKRTSSVTTDLFVFNDAGNMGVGKSPGGAVRLDVSNTTGIVAQFDSTTANGGYVQFTNSAALYGYVGTGLQLVTGGLVTDYALRAVTNMLFATGATERMRIDSSGNVGIGKTPAVRLDVTTAANAIAAFDTTSGTSGYAQFSNSGTVYGYLGNGILTSGATTDVCLRAQANMIFAAGGSTARLTISSAGVVSDATAELGWKDIPMNAQAGPYTLLIGDRGKCVTVGATGATVPASVFSAGNVVTIYNNSASSQTITQGASVTLYFGATGGTGNRTLTARGIATVVCLASNTFVITGAGLS